MPFRRHRHAVNWGNLLGRRLYSVKVRNERRKKKKGERSKQTATPMQKYRIDPPSFIFLVCFAARRAFVFALDAACYTRAFARHACVCAVSPGLYFRKRWNIYLRSQSHKPDESGTPASQTIIKAARAEFRPEMIG